MSESPDILKTIVGRGLVSAEGCEAVRVRYHIVVEKRGDGVLVHGTLNGRHSGLWPIWLEPDAVLRLKTGRTLAISVTDLLGDAAEFECVGPTPDL